LSLRAERSNLAFSTRDKLRNPGFNYINNFEIAASQKALLAMTFREFFSSLLDCRVFRGCSRRDWVPELSLRNKILRGVYPERDSSVASLLQNDRAEGVARQPGDFYSLQVYLRGAGPFVITRSDAHTTSPSLISMVLPAFFAFSSLCVTITIVCPSA
jgi:hypothetical protein